MSISQTSPATTSVIPALEWAPVIGGAIAAAAISFVLLTFGAAVVAWLDGQAAEGDRKKK